MFPLITAERCARLRHHIVRQGRHALATLCVVTLGFAAPQPVATAGAHTFDRAEREQRLTRTLAAIGDLRAALDRKAFDTEALLDSLDYDPETIIDFVRNEIRFEPYEGLLRGVQGTLMSQAGNALDQALLLAYLLGEAGVDARLAHGMLDQDQALLLVRSLRGLPDPSSANALPDLRSHMQKVIQAAGVDDDTADTVMQFVEDSRRPQDLPIWAAAEAGRDYLREHLSKADITLAPTDAEAFLAAQSLSYFWVEYKDGANDPWLRAHPLAAADNFDEQAVPTLERLSESVPERFQHRLRITAKLERQAAGNIEVVSLMQPWERPVANLLGKRLSFANQPNGVKSLDDLQDLSQIEAGTTLLIPTFNDQPAPGAQAFDLRGRTIALSALQMDTLGAAALFQTAGDKTLDAADALGGLSIRETRDADLPTTAYSLRRVWLEYTSIHPNGTERVDQRTIWQAPAAMSPAPSAALWELATSHGIGVASSAYPVGYLLDRDLARLQAIEPVLRWALAAHEIPPGQALPAVPEIDPDWSGFPELSYVGQFDAGIDPDDNTLLAYRAEPTIVVTRHGLRHVRGDTSGFADVDIIHNRRTVLRTDASSVKTDPLQALRLGAWDTLVEQTGLESRLPVLLAAAPDTVISANRMYQDPQRRSQAPLILSRLEDLPVLAEALAASSRLALEEDLQRGYVVATETPSQTSPLVWWRIDPATGEALGRGQDGRGQAFTEALDILSLISIKTSMVVGTTICAASKNNCNFTDCLTSAAINTSIGLGIGGILGGTFGAAAGGLLAAVVDRAGMGWNPLPVCYND